MKKETYERTELDVMVFSAADVILTSITEYEEDELPLVNNGG